MAWYLDPFSKTVKLFTNASDPDKHLKALAECANRQVAGPKFLQAGGTEHIDVGFCSAA